MGEGHGCKAVAVKVIIVGKGGLIALHCQLQLVKICCVDETSEHFSFKVLINATDLKEISNKFTFHTVVHQRCSSSSSRLRQ